MKSIVPRTVPDSTDHTTVQLPSLLPENIRVSTVGYVYYFPVKEIVRIEASSAYSRLVFSNGRTLLTARVLSCYEDILQASGFLRIHRAHLINTHYLSFFTKGKNVTACLLNGERIPVAKRKKVLIGKLVI